MTSPCKIAALKNAVGAVEKMPMFQRAGHIMPLVHILIQVLEQQGAEIEQLTFKVKCMNMRGDM